MGAEKLELEEWGMTICQGIREKIHAPSVEMHLILFQVVELDFRYEKPSNMAYRKESMDVFKKFVILYLLGRIPKR